MSNEKKIREARMMFEERMKQAAQASLYGTVKSVDEKARTCEVQIGGIVYEDVLLYAVVNDGLPGRARTDPQAGQHGDRRPDRRQ